MITIFTEFIDQLIDYPINCASLSGVCADQGGRCLRRVGVILIDVAHLESIKPKSFCSEFDNRAFANELIIRTI